MLARLSFPVIGPAPPSQTGRKQFAVDPAISLESRPTIGVALPARRIGWLRNYFYFFMSLLIGGVIVYGFHFTVNQNLIHPTIPRPFILYVHAAFFSTWVLFYIFQSALVRTRNVRVHRQIGWFGVGLGATMPVLGVATAIAMGRFDTLQLHTADAASSLIVPLFDMGCFTTTFALAIYWRQKPELHRRLLRVATCALTAAAFGRFPANLLPPILFYAGVDALILLGVARDFIVNRRIHRVYLYALPLFTAGQTIVTYVAWHNVPYWMKIARALLGQSA